MALDFFAGCVGGELSSFFNYLFLKFMSERTIVKDIKIKICF